MENNIINVNISINHKTNEVIINSKKITLQNENNFPIGRVARGIYIQNIQIFLKELNEYNLKKYGTDGVYGSETEDCVLKTFGRVTIGYKEYSMIENFLVSINKFKKL